MLIYCTIGAKMQNNRSCKIEKLREKQRVIGKTGKDHYFGICYVCSNPSYRLALTQKRLYNRGLSKLSCVS